MAVLLALSASALQVVQPRITAPVGGMFKAGSLMPQQPLKEMPRRAAAAGDDDSQSSMHYSPAGSPYGYTSFKKQSAGMKIAEAFQITKTVANKFAGNEVREIYFYTGYNKALSSQQKVVNTIKKATLFLADNLENFEPFYTQTVDLPEDGLSLVSFALDTPYKIEAGKPVYVGYYYALSSADDVTLIYDYVNHGSDTSGGWCGIMPAPSDAQEIPEWQFDNFAGQIGFLCLGVNIVGNQLPINEVSVQEASVQPTVYQNDPFSLDFVVMNEASDIIETLDIEVKVGEDAPRTENVEFSGSFGYGQRGMISLSELCYATAGLEAVPVTVTVTNVNGKPNNSATPAATVGIQVLPTGKGFQRNVVVEEFTGTWCPNCPRGLVAMESLRTNYTDGSVIPVGIHGGDAMQSPSYYALANTYCNGYPDAIMNRLEYINNLYPGEDFLNEIETFKLYPAPAKVTATAQLKDDKSAIIFDTRTSFTFDNDKAADDYILSFGVTEDNVGPYEQKSNFSGTDLPGWGDKPSVVETMYNDVARQYNSQRGITGSIPAKVEEGKEYEFHYEMKFLAASKIGNKDNLNGIVYLINRNTGVVENACMVANKELGAIDTVTVDSSFDTDAPVEYFNLQGIRVADPVSGIYIRRQGSKVEKVAVK